MGILENRKDGGGVGKSVHRKRMKKMVLRGFLSTQSKIVAARKFRTRADKPTTRIRGTRYRKDNLNFDSTGKEV